MFGLAGTPPRALRHPMSQVTDAAVDQKPLQCDKLASSEMEAEPLQ